MKSEKMRTDGFHQTAAVPSISLPGTLDENGPQGFTMGLTGGSSAMAYTSEDVMAATFTRELIYDLDFGNKKGPLCYKSKTVF